MRYILAFVLLFTGLSQLLAQTADFTISDTLKCGDSLVVDFTNTSNPEELNVTYTWSFGNGLTSHDVSPAKILFAKTGHYYVTLTMTQTDNPANIFTRTKTIYVRPIPNPNFFIADTFNLGPLAYVFRSGRIPYGTLFDDTISYKFEWTLNPKDGNYDYKVTHPRQNEFIRDTLIYPFATEGTNYMQLKVSDYLGCSDSLIQRFIVSEKLVVPKAFTPNGDNINDFFIVPTNGRTIYSLQIFSITGQLVFKSESKSIIWDGNLMNGSEAAPGNYLYIIEPASSAQKVTGFVMLLRKP